MDECDEVTEYKKFNRKDTEQQANQHQKTFKYTLVSPTPPAPKQKQIAYHSLKFLLRTENKACAKFCGENEVHVNGAADFLFLKIAVIACE